jgi:hypothetical protein
MKSRRVTYRLLGVPASASAPSIPPLHRQPAALVGRDSWSLSQMETTEAGKQEPEQLEFPFTSL